MYAGSLDVKLIVWHNVCWISGCQVDCTFGVKSVKKSMLSGVKMVELSLGVDR